MSFCALRTNLDLKGFSLTLSLYVSLSLTAELHVTIQVFFYLINFDYFYYAFICCKNLFFLMNTLLFGDTETFNSTQNTNLMSSCVCLCVCVCFDIHCNLLAIVLFLFLIIFFFSFLRTEICRRFAAGFAVARRASVHYTTMSLAKLK